jgi:hypothetical protein
VQDGYVAKDGKSESSEGLDAKGIKEFKARMVKKLIAAIGDPTVGSVCRVANYYRRTASNQVCGQYAGVDHKECISQLGEVSSLFSKACQGDVAWPPSIMSDGTLVSPKPGEVAADSEPEPLREPVPKPKPQQKSKPKPQQAKKKPQEDYCLAVERGMIGKSVNVTKNKCCPVPARSDCGLPRERLQFLCRNGINWACY